ncbi:sensor histidine kinase [filamentous cyanobacterium LEGE 11480]|uniref:histidine kinase n=1 Tax=Romeriopsis navalis LEGE 11480 TaxID=2777977 RepID=A0A928VKZ5_9CYAN|nr:sensor histidine kinase [Romeriopsis navalis]MBE9030486.1 sensor histidine kinase [Romeriopsis navalis LEGE 11480]
MNHSTNLLYHRYRFIALVVYIAVLVTGIADWLYGGLGPRSLVIAPDFDRFCIFALSVLLLIVIELLSLGQADFDKRQPGRLLPFLLRLCLFVSACAVTDLFYSPILFLPILLYCHFAVSKRLSYGIAICGVVTLFGLSVANIGGISAKPPPPPVTNHMRPPSKPIGGLIDRSAGALITVLFTLLLARAMSQATAAQQKLTDLLSNLEASHTQLQSYATQVADLAASEERNRLARNIHDSLGHHLAAISIQLAKAHAYRDRDPIRANEAITYAQHTVQDALKDVRESVSSLRQNGDAFAFHTALQDLLQRMEHSDLILTLHQTGDSSHYGQLKLLILYRVIQEGLTNVHKHAKASHVMIILHFGPHFAHLELADNGVGFNVSVWQEHAHEPSTYGLIGLKERLTLVGGSLEISSQSTGTKLKVKLPQTNQPVSFSPTPAYDHQ